MRLTTDNIIKLYRFVTKCISIDHKTFVFAFREEHILDVFQMFSKMPESLTPSSVGFFHKTTTNFWLDGKPTMRCAVQISYATDLINRIVSLCGKVFDNIRSFSLQKVCFFSKLFGMMINTGCLGLELFQLHSL